MKLKHMILRLDLFVYLFNLFSFLATPFGKVMGDPAMSDLSSPTRDRTRVSCIGSPES